MPAGLDFEMADSFDAVIVGSISRNAQIAYDLARLVDPSKTIWIHGEDRPPTVREMSTFVESGIHVYVRSIDR